MHFFPVPFSDFKKVLKTVAFSGAAGNGAQGTVALFTGTGAFQIFLIPVCRESLAGATATIAAGVVGNTGGLIASTTATGIQNAMAWVDSTPGTAEAMPSTKILVNGADPILTIGTADITDGTIDFYAYWKPISADGNLVAA